MASIFNNPRAVCDQPAVEVEHKLNKRERSQYIKIFLGSVVRLGDGLAADNLDDDTRDKLSAEAIGYADKLLGDHRAQTNGREIVEYLVARRKANA